MERALSFECEGERLCAILHEPRECSALGVVVVVGGPQYRVGSHRLFVTLARALAERGFAVMRFDYRGMGDSEGDMRSFEGIEADIARATDALCRAAQGVKQVVIWGLCDAASAACLCAHKDGRVRGLVLVNPWMRTEAGIANAYLKHYYWRRLVSTAFWRKLGRGELRIGAAVRSLLDNIRSAGMKQESTGRGGERGETLPERMAAGASAFEGKMLFVLSGDDLTAAEFRDAARQSESWREILSGDHVEIRELPEANHTFSRRGWKDQLASWTADWMGSL